MSHTNISNELLKSMLLEILSKESINEVKIRACQHELERIGWGEDREEKSTSLLMSCSKCEAEFSCKHNWSIEPEYECTHYKHNACSMELECDEEMSDTIVEILQKEG